MTPKEKAKELVEKFYGLPTGNTNRCVDWLTATESALVTIDAMLQIQSITMYPIIEDNMIYGHKDYWNKVKQEINSL